MDLISVNSIDFLSYVLQKKTREWKADTAQILLLIQFKFFEIEGRKMHMFRLLTHRLVAEAGKYKAKCHQELV